MGLFGENGIFGTRLFLTRWKDVGQRETTREPRYTQYGVPGSTRGDGIRLCRVGIG